MDAAHRCDRLAGVTIKKSVHPRQLPGIHPGLDQRIREAEEAELRGDTPRGLDEAQKVIRQSIDAMQSSRRQQVRTIGLVDPAARAGEDGVVALAEQEAFMPGADLDKVWDTLTEAEKVRAGATERFRLELEASLRQAAMPWEAPYKLGGRLDARALKRSAGNLRAEIEAFHYLLAPDSRALLDRFVDETRELLDTCLKQRAVQGIEITVMHDILRDLVQKLIYQELASRRRAMGDRGIRRICGNIDLAERIYAALRRLPDFSPRERLLMRIIHVHQDLGHTAYAARTSYRGGRLHRAYGARIFTDELNRYRVLLTQAELEVARSAVATHSSDELPFDGMRLLSLVRAVDHLAPFAPHRAYKHLDGLPGAADYLDDMLERAVAGNIDGYIVAKEAFRVFLADTTLHPALRDDIWAAFRPVERFADPIDLGELAGEVGELQIDLTGHGAVLAMLAPDPFALKYQALFDTQQDQLLRLARATGVPLEHVRKLPALKFQRPGSGSLMIHRPGTT
jgi:hypothetical protein